MRDLAVRGAEVICVPTANMPEYDAVQTVLLPARALENTVYVAYANYCGVEGDLAYGGLSEGIGPDGRVLARAEREPELLVVDVERKVLDDARERFTYLDDRRSDCCRNARPLGRDTSSVDFNMKFGSAIIQSSHLRRSKAISETLGPMCRQSRRDVDMTYGRVLPLPTGQ